MRRPSSGCPFVPACVFCGADCWLVASPQRYRCMRVAPITVQLPPTWEHTTIPACGRRFNLRRRWRNRKREETR